MDGLIKKIKILFNFLHDINHPLNNKTIFKVLNILNIQKK